MTDAKHNHPPSDQELVLQPFADAIAEAQNWLDGEPVQSEDQMKAVDALITQVRKAKTTLEAERKKAVAPLNDAVKAENAAWKAVQEPIEITLTALVEIVRTTRLKSRQRKQRQHKQKPRRRARQSRPLSMRRGRRTAAEMQKSIKQLWKLRKQQRLPSAKPARPTARHRSKACAP